MFSKITTKYKIIIASGLILAVVMPFSLRSAVSYRVNASQTVNINEHGVNKNVTNNGAGDIFVPTNSANEWNNFQTNKPPTTDVANACDCNTEPESPYGETCYMDQDEIQTDHSCQANNCYYYYRCEWGGWNPTGFSAGCQGC